MDGIGYDTVGKVVAVEICHAHGRDGVFIMGRVGNFEIARSIGCGIENQADCPVGLCNPSLFVDGKVRAELCKNKLARNINAFVIRFRTGIKTYIFPVSAELCAESVCIGGFVGELIIISVCADAEGEVIEFACKACQIGAVVGTCNAYRGVESCGHAENTDIGVAGKAEVVVPKALVGAVCIVSCCNRNVYAGVKGGIEHGGYFGITCNGAAACAEAEVCSVNAQKYCVFKRGGNIRHACSAVCVENFHNNKLRIGSNADVLDVIGVYQVGSRCACNNARNVRTVSHCVG